MDKKWGYVSGSLTALAAVGVLISSIFESSFTVGLAIATLVLALFSLASIFIVVSKIEKTTQTILRNREQRLRTSQSNTQNQVVDSETEDDAKANSESATTADHLIDNHTDEESGLLSHSFFPVYLDQRINAARRTLRPVSLVIFILDGLEKNDSNSPSDREFFIAAVGDVVKRTLRESDCGFRIDENTFAAVMDDTAESGAVWAAERVRGVLHTGALAGRVTISAGVACYPSHALEPDELIGRATKALKTARERGVDQVEIAADLQ